nr:hypothetical protein [Tanacetum cinerariifolium]
MGFLALVRLENTLGLRFSCFLASILSLRTLLAFLDLLRTPFIFALSLRDEGTGSIPGVPDAPTDESEEEISWNSTNDEGADNEGKDGDDDEEDEGDDGEERDGDDDDEDDDGKEGHDDDDDQEVVREDEKDDEEEGNGDEDLGLNVDGEEGHVEEEEEDELYRDVNINCDLHFRPYNASNGAALILAWDEMYRFGKAIDNDPDGVMDMLHICLRVHGQSFDEPPFEEEILAFIHFLGQSASIRTLTDVNINKLYQPWRSFAAIINKCLTGKSSGHDSLRLSQAQILRGLYHKRNVDCAYLTNSNDYKEYYAIATGAAPPKPKASVRRTRSSFDTSITPPTAATHISQASGSGTDEGTGSIPGVPDAPTDESEEEISWNSTNDEGADNEGKDGDDDEEDEGDDGEERDGDDDDEDEVVREDEKDDEEEGGDDEQGYDKKEYDEETRDEKSFDPIL